MLKYYVNSSLLT